MNNTTGMNEERNNNKLNYCYYYYCRSIYIHLSLRSLRCWWPACNQISGKQYSYDRPTSSFMIVLFSFVLTNLPTSCVGGMKSTETDIASQRQSHRNSNTTNNNNNNKFSNIEFDTIKKIS
mmetsp:Transcript_60354/g.67533  ORF Transcript_60354/g.67533 Transcript_60354/m.67533 type:complete len:121 (+) Transcript_60354:51-413(+)